MEKILVSKCLLGDNCKYDGKNNYNEAVIKLQNEYHLVPVCPECLGGLKSPRLKAEIRSGKVINQNNEDVTEYFLKGAKITLDLAIKENIKKAVMKSNSPSCGFGKIYDGSFNHVLKDGNGIAASYLNENGIEIYNENNCERLKGGNKNE